MIDPEAADRQRAKWHSYFQRTIGGSPGEVDAATEGALAAIARREDQAGVVAAGIAAARRYREGGHTPVKPTRAMSGGPAYQTAGPPMSPAAALGMVLL